MFCFVFSTFLWLIYFFFLTPQYSKISPHLFPLSPLNAAGAPLLEIEDEWKEQQEEQESDDESEEEEEEEGQQQGGRRTKQRPPIGIQQAEGLSRKNIVGFLRRCCFFVRLRFILRSCLLTCAFAPSNEPEDGEENSENNKKEEETVKTPEEGKSSENSENSLSLAVSPPAQSAISVACLVLEMLVSVAQSSVGTCDDLMNTPVCFFLILLLW